MPLTLSGSGGITYPDGTVNTTRSLSSAGDTVNGVLTFARQDASAEGGEIRLNRSSDNATGWVFDVLGSTATPTLRIFNAANKGVYIDGNGLLDLASAGAGQIKFPASANISSDANTLDDFEEGSGGFSSVQKDSSGGGVGLGENSYYYTKIGRFVHMTFRVLIATPTSATTWRLNGLPFTNAVGDVSLGTALGQYNGMPQQVYGGSTFLEVRVAGVDGSPNSWPYLFGHVVYFT